MKFYNKGSFFFSLFLLLFLFVLFFQTLGYDSVTRLVPLLVLVPTIIILLLSIAIECFPNIFSKLNLNQFGSDMGKINADEDTVENIGLADNRGFLIVTVWIIFLTLLIVLFGFIIAAPIAIFTFVKLTGKEKWLRPLIFTVLFTASSYFLINVLLKIELFKGILFGDYFY